MRSERKIMEVISKSIKGLNTYSKTYAIGKGVRRYIFYKEIELKHFELLIEDIASLKGVLEVKHDDKGYYLNTELGELKIREGKLDDYFKTQSFSLNRIALSDKGFVFSPSVEKRTYRWDINNRDATLLEPTDSTMYEYCYLRYEGFTTSNSSAIEEYMKIISNKKRMYGLKLALELGSSNITDSFKSLDVFSLIKGEESSYNIYNFFMNCVKNIYNTDETISKEDRINNSLIALTYALTKGRDFSDNKFDDIFRDFGIDIPWSIYNDVKRIFTNGKSDDIYNANCGPMNPNSKFIQHLVNRYEVMCGE